MLTKKFSLEKIKEILLKKENHAMFPNINDRTLWNNLDCFVKESTINEAEKYLNYTIEPLTPTLYMEYAVNGNRVNYEKIHFGRRQALSALIVAECIEDNGRFLNDIINILWAICEETTWVIPGHNIFSFFDENEVAQPLPKDDITYIDLFSAETGGVLSWTYYLLKDRLNAVSPLICLKIQNQLKEKIIKPFLKYDNMWWMGNTGHKLNNWNAWCSSNIITVALIIENDADLRAKVIYKLMGIIDRFIESYPNDGGCDEGPEYWGHAGGSLFNFLEQLSFATDGVVSIYDEQKIKNIASYVYKMNIDSLYYVNFADCPAKVHHSGLREYLFGKCTGNEILQMYGVRMYSLSENKLNETAMSALYKLFSIFNYSEIVSYESSEEVVLKDVWLPDTQIMCARYNESSNKGFFIAAKGGNNDESHNHNDVGSYIIYKDGKPVVCDIGIEVYSKKSFSSERYTIWITRSSYHNLPTFNGIEQMAGSEYVAKNVSYYTTDDNAGLTLDMSLAYPKESKLGSYKRSIDLDRNSNKVVLTDSIKMADETDDIYFTFMLPNKPHSMEDGALELSENCIMKYDSELLEYSLEEISIDDIKLLACWGDKIYRAKLSLKKIIKSNDFVFEFTNK